MRSSTVGPMIRDRRVRAGRSQLDVALDVGVSARHFSFVELGKSRPSPELVVLIADRLGAPRREANDWLLAAGFAPAFAESGLDAPSMAQVRRSLQQLLDAHEPLPAVVLDRRWTVQLTNQAAIRLADGISGDESRGDPTNLFRISLHPDGFGSRTVNFAAWSAYLLRQLDHAVSRTRDPYLSALAEEIATWPNIPTRNLWDRPALPDESDIVVPWQLEQGDVVLSMFTTMSTFGTPVDITLSELTIEMFFAADEATEHAFRQHRRPKQRAAIPHR